MSNPNKQKGTRHETEIVNYLREEGIDARRVVQTGAKDTGDIHAQEFVIQAKSWANIADALREGTDGAQRQAVHAGKPYGVAVIKRPRKGIAEAYVSLPLRVFAQLLKLLPR